MAEKIRSHRLRFLTGPLHVTRECPGGHRDGTCGKPYIGVKTKLIDVDPVTKEGEIAFSCRNTFMGYIKVNIFL